MMMMMMMMLVVVVVVIMMIMMMMLMWARLDYDVMMWFPNDVLFFPSILHIPYYIDVSLGLRSSDHVLLVPHHLIIWHHLIKQTRHDSDTCCLWFWLGLPEFAPLATDGPPTDRPSPLRPLVSNLSGAGWGRWGRGPGITGRDTNRPQIIWCFKMIYVYSL